MNVPDVIFIEDGPNALEKLPALSAVPKDRDITVICDKDGASDQVAAILRMKRRRPSISWTE